MKRVIVFLFFGFFLLFLVSAETVRSDSNTSDRKTGDVNTDKPKIVFEKQVHDFGKQYIGEILNYKFKFKNKGSGELVIYKVKSSCGCTAALVSKNKLLKNEEGEIDITFNPGQQTGKISKSIIVDSNDQDNPGYTLTVIAEVFEEVSVTPKRVHFGIIKKGERAVKILDIKTTPELGIEVVKVESPNPYIAIILMTKEENHYSYQLVIDDYDHIGKFTGIIFVYTTSKRQERVDVPFFGEIAGDLTFYPETLSFGTARKGHSPKRTVIVNFLNKGVKIKKIEIDPEIMNYTVSELNSSQKIDVKLHDDIAAGKFKGDIKIYTDSVIQPLITIHVTGEIKE
ncbi:MAG: DUF1573 domain-containing protein [Candidatus Loosdrechtia sp.]|uniref:DUF1573 domain-containing protein n=1 Tax=Candidatus Loosdrechtia sp. TaxID=3101272 RepID=UPI003A78C13E|nr:MAG: DUF1573 domain-containing protein [Candidatus Jettenia sp. AMX2]